MKIFFRSSGILKMVMSCCIVPSGLVGRQKENGERKKERGRKGRTPGGSNLASDLRVSFRLFPSSFSLLRLGRAGLHLVPGLRPLSVHDLGRPAGTLCSPLGAF